VIRAEEYSCGDMRQFALDCGGFRALRQFATNHDVLRQPRPPSHIRRRQKTPVVEHKGLFSGWVFFRAYAPRLQ